MHENRTRFAVAVLLSLVVLAGFGPAPVLAAGGGGGGGGGDGDMTAQRQESPDYTAAVKAIKAGDHAKAIALLQGVVAREASNADAFNWLAYATRKNGDPAAAIPIYEKALAIDPKHRGAHEYIGEAYLDLNNLAKAKEHLKRLDALCFFSCSEYRDLKKAVQAYEARSGGVTPATSGR
jgi:tetratricopeptide (TPR) repeat protein